MSQDLQTLANTLRGLMTEYSTNNKTIADLRTRNDVINAGIRNIYEQIRQTPLELDKEPALDTGALQGLRCFKCNRVAKYRCFWCFVDDKPSGYCDNHTHIHKKQFPDHHAILQRIFHTTNTPKPDRVKLTPEQEKEHWLKVLADAQKELAKLE